MIADNDTNKIYLADKLKSDFPNTCEKIEKVLKTFGIKPDFLPDTRDIWARDFMPIQVNEDKFIQYRYDPDYLQGKWKGYRDLKTYPDIVCDLINLKTTKSDLILDGGNVVKSADCVILTDKIVNENQFSFSKQKLIEKLQKTFEVTHIVLVPWDKKDKYGHSDGVLRFINNDTVLISDIYKVDTVLLYRLKQSGLKCEFLNFQVKKRDKRNWAYINFLQTKDLIILPKFNIDEDKQAFEQIANFYPDYAKNDKITQVDMSEIVKFKGALNCITWTIKK